MTQHQLKEQVDQAVLGAVQVGKQEQAVQVIHLPFLLLKVTMAAMVAVHLLIKAAQVAALLEQEQIYHGQQAMRELLAEQALFLT